MPALGTLTTGMGNGIRKEKKNRIQIKAGDQTENVYLLSGSQSGQQKGQRDFPCQMLNKQMVDLAVNYFNYLMKNTCIILQRKEVIDRKISSNKQVGRGSRPILILIFK